MVKIYLSEFSFQILLFVHVGQELASVHSYISELIIECPDITVNMK